MKGGPLNSYALAFAILGSGLLVAAVLWSVPLLRRRTQVRRFRQSLDHVDAVVMGWTEAVRGENHRFDTSPEPSPGFRRHRGHPGEQDEGGAASY